MITLAAVYIREYIKSVVRTHTQIHFGLTARPDRAVLCRRFFSSSERIAAALAALRNWSGGNFFYDSPEFKRLSRVCGSQQKVLFWQWPVSNIASPKPIVR